MMGGFASHMRGSSSISPSQQQQPQQPQQPQQQQSYFAQPQRLQATHRPPSHVPVAPVPQASVQPITRQPMPTTVPSATATTLPKSAGVSAQYTSTPADVWASLANAQQAAQQAAQRQVQEVQRQVQQGLVQQFSANVERTAAEESRRIEAEFRKQTEELDQRARLAAEQFKAVQARLASEFQAARDRRAAQLHDIQIKTAALVPLGKPSAPILPKSSPLPSLPALSSGPALWASVDLAGTGPGPANQATSIPQQPSPMGRLTELTAAWGAPSPMYERNPIFEQWCERMLHMKPRSVVATTIDMLCRALIGHGRIPPPELLMRLPPAFVARHRASFALFARPPEVRQTTTTTASLSSTTTTSHPWPTTAPPSGFFEKSRIQQAEQQSPQYSAQPSPQYSAQHSAQQESADQQRETQPRAVHHTTPTADVDPREATAAQQTAAQHEAVAAHQAASDASDPAALPQRAARETTAEDKQLSMEDQEDDQAIQDEYDAHIDNNEAIDPKIIPVSRRLGGGARLAHPSSSVRHSSSRIERLRR